MEFFRLAPESDRMFLNEVVPFSFRDALRNKEIDPKSSWQSPLARVVRKDRGRTLLPTDHFLFTYRPVFSERARRALKDIQIEKDGDFLEVANDDGFNIVLFDCRTCDALLSSGTVVRPAENFQNEESNSVVRAWRDGSRLQSVDWFEFSTECEGRDIFRLPKTLEFFVSSRFVECFLGNGLLGAIFYVTRRPFSNGWVDFIPR